jgi:guanylate kinase
MGRFVMLSGPSCVGKGPLHNALKRFYPYLEQKLEKLILFNSRAPRTGWGRWRAVAHDFVYEMLEL